MVQRGILTLGAPGSESPFPEASAGQITNEVWVHLGLQSLEKWEVPKDLCFERVYLELEALGKDLSDGKLHAWKGALNAFLLRLIHKEGRVPLLVGVVKSRSWEMALAAIKLGVRDLITDSELYADLQASLRSKTSQNTEGLGRVLLFPSGEKPNETWNSPTEKFPEILKNIPENAIPFPIEGLEGDSAAIESVRSIIRKAAPMNSSILIVGPTGSGKERVAQTLHRYSQRSQMKFVVLDCASINPNLFESELFGHVQGAFTNALQERKGVFEMAHRGTLFIDQIHLLSLEQQTKLLRVLQDKRFTPVGSHESIEVDVRIVAASQVSLDEWVTLGKFREDLYFRIKVIDIYLPSLSERRSDIPQLAESMLKKLSKSQRRPVLQLSGSCLEKILLYDWPGNIRELHNSLERASTLAWSDGRQEIRVSDLPEMVQFAVMKKYKTQTLKDATKRFEQEYITQTLRKFGGSKEEAAEALGLSLATLYRKIGS